MGRGGGVGEVQEGQMGLICKMKKKLIKKIAPPVSSFSSNHVFKGLNVIVINLVIHFTKPYIS